jgi:hypothetical protein
VSLVLGTIDGQGDLALSPRSRADARQLVASIMTDVFISYANGDRERARDIANALSARGWSVWWDRKIKAGQTFDEVIERELDTAKNIVVLWSGTSVVSEWVKNEAAVAAQRRVLVPVLLDDVKLPLEFRRKQTIDLVGWDGDPAGLQALYDALGAPRAEGTTAPASAIRAKQSALQFRPWIVAGAAGFAAGCVVTYLLLVGWADSGESAGHKNEPASSGAGSAPAARSGLAEMLALKRQDKPLSLPVNLATSTKGVFLDVVGFQKVGELTTLEMSLRSTSDEKVLVCSGASEARLIDQISGESWRATHSGGPAGTCQWIPGRGQLGAWAKFKLAGLENRRFSLDLPILHKAPELPGPQLSSK